MGKNEIIESLNAEVAEYEIPLKTPPKTVLDIGANIGVFSMRARKQWPDASITAFEPVPQVVDILRQNATENISVRPVAVRSFNGRCDILAGDCLVTSSFHDTGRQVKGCIPVDCIDASELDSAEFVKIDTEGCEVEIISRLDLSNTKAVALEYHSNTDRVIIEGFFKSAGFEPYRNYFAGKDEGVLRYVRHGVELKEPKKKLFIGIPVYGGIDAHFWKCSMALAAEFPVNCEIYPLCGDSLVPRARNSITMQFLKSDCTHMLQIDSDLIFSNDHIKRIFNSGVDVVGGFYPKKKEGAVELVCNALDPQPPMDEVSRLTALKYIGTGFLCVTREVIEKMISVYGEHLKYISDVDRKTVEYDLWSVGVYKYPDGYSRYLSEDWYFCQRALDLGYKVYGDNGICLRHSGSAVYPLSTQIDGLFSKIPSVSSDSIQEQPTLISRISAKADSAGLEKPEDSPPLAEPAHTLTPV